MYPKQTPSRPLFEIGFNLEAIYDSPGAVVSREEKPLHHVSMVAKGQKYCYHGNLMSHFSTPLNLDICREDPSLAIRVKAKI